MICSICLYTGRPDGTDLDPDDWVTVMNGQAVCVDHAGLVGNVGDRSQMLMHEVRARGHESLSALQTANAQARTARLHPGATS